MMKRLNLIAWNKENIETNSTTELMKIIDIELITNLC